MPSIKREALVPYTCGQMFELVNDIDAYPDFLPWCSRTEVLSRNAAEVVATLHLSWKGLSKSFTTKNTLTTNHLMTLSLVEGPFSHLQGVWQFDPLGDEGSKITFKLEFEFSNSVVRYAFSQVFDYVANSLVDHFISRADSLYGKSLP